MGVVAACCHYSQKKQKLHWWLFEHLTARARATHMLGSAVPGGRDAQGWWKNLYVQVLIAITIGILLGLSAPSRHRDEAARRGFISWSRYHRAGDFLTIVAGIAKIGDLRMSAGSGSGTDLFRSHDTLALVLGLLVANLLQPAWGWGSTGADRWSGIAQYQNRLKSRARSLPARHHSARFRSHSPKASCCRCWWRSDRVA